MDYEELLKLFEEGTENCCQQYRSQFCEWHDSGELSIKAIWWNEQDKADQFGMIYERQPDVLQIVGTDTIYYRMAEFC